MLMSSQCWSKYQREATRGFCHKVFTNITPGTHRAAISPTFPRQPFYKEQPSRKPTDEVNGTYTVPLITRS